MARRIPFGRLPVPIVILGDNGKRHVGFGELFVELQSLQRCSPRLWYEFSRWSKSVPACQRVRIG